jgi:hypothetical protein
MNLQFPNLALLHACLAHDDAARAAFDRWQREFNLDDIDNAGFVLLPLLETRLSRLGIEHPWRGRLQGVQRKRWIERQLNVRESEALLHRLLPLDERIVPLAPHDGDAASLDEPATILVPRSAAENCLRTAAAAGWTTKHPTCIHDPATVCWRSSITLQNAAKCSTVLRWRLLDVPSSEQLNDEMREYATVQDQSREGKKSGAIRFDAAALLLMTAMRRHHTTTSLALACITLRDAAETDHRRLRAYAERSDATQRVEALLRSCRAILAGHEATTDRISTWSTFLRSFDAHAKTEGHRRTPAALAQFAVHYADASSLASVITSRIWRRHDSA